MKKRALCPLSGVHLTIKPKICIVTIAVLRNLCRQKKRANTSLSRPPRRTTSLLKKNRRARFAYIALFVLRNSPKITR